MGSLTHLTVALCIQNHEKDSDPKGAVPADSYNGSHDTLQHLGTGHVDPCAVVSLVASSKDTPPVAYK
jgi:hypothetical protein